MKNSDLHTHSYYSDGQISPKELVRLAKRREIKNLALTDHNSIKGVREAIKEGKKIGVYVIPAVEVRCGEGEVLGYFINIDNKKLIKEMKESSKRVEVKIKDWCKNLKIAGYDVSFREIWEKYPKARGNINEFYPLFELYLKGYGKTMKIAEKLKKQKIKKKKIKEISVFMGVKLIKNARGVPVLAHPWIDKNFFINKNIKKCVELGLRGIEINNGDRAPFRKKNWDKKIKKMAKKYNLILTSGSDYHGLKLVKNMPGNHELGKNNCDEKIVEQLRNLSNR